MIIVVEGIDKVGKTTFAKKLEDAGFIYLKDEFMLPEVELVKFANYSIGKCDSFVKVVKELDKAGKNVVVDRLHLTEAVYGTEDRSGMTNLSAVFAIDMILANMGAMLVYFKPIDITFCNKIHGSDLSKKSELFDYFYRMSSMKKVQVTHESIDFLIESVMEETFEYDFYFASPFFNPDQVEREERMIKHLRDLGFRVFSPKEACHLNPKADARMRELVFSENCNAINKSRAVFAVTDGKDMGTIWEAGYAYGTRKPVIYFAETLGNNTFNLMLAESGRDVYLSQDEVTYGSLLESLRGAKRRYRGDIE